ncbi:MAG: hypothetical protein ACYCW6_09720 [Candidatus Xenobia bacterium]
MLQVTRAPGQCPYDVRMGLSMHREQVDAWRGVHRANDVISGELNPDDQAKHPDLPTYDPRASRMQVDATWRESGGADIDVRSATEKPGLWLRVMMDKLAGVGILCVGHDGGAYNAAITVPLGDLTNADKQVFDPAFLQSRTPLQHVHITQPAGFHNPVVITLNDDATHLVSIPVG